MAQTTKRALAASLKKLLGKKTLDKITVVDIVEDCEVNRQTFYYHFQDIYDLVEWIFLTEAEKAIGGKKTYDTWQQGFLQLLLYVRENGPLVINAYHSISRDQLERYLYRVTYDLLIGVVEEQAAGMSVRDEDKRFIADFYKFAFVGLTLDWIRTGMKEDPARIIDRLSILIHGDITRALEKYRTDRQN
ncbi:TetR-like C-terminal domain-containing protein [Zongyangia hominis]|uniref:TetR/AcrR family transcriptional regulator C-terminal domain-containing protein n=1 Tax=Zongyangia hominis TaxID=2763677 RepID=A0A926EDS8_9FIRM|nr:TetR-like C-terminal domain-containing protein [Zongyangia hominis]MBC8571240.1 TetR/AcrR family transcriptional regulator C-terminal domain-containing protein [Zongyangia hominis]